MNILVTGAGGLIGSHATQLLRKQGLKVFAAYRNPDVEDTDSVVGDLAEPDFFLKLSGINPQIIVHCAAAIPGINSHTLQTSAQVNKLIDENIIDYCEKNKCKLIYISSVIVYGYTNKIRSEKTIAEPMSDYGIEKFKTEIKIQNKIKDYIILRISAPYGPIQKSNTVLKLFIRKALNNEPIKYFGTGNRSQDFTHADDIAQAILLSLDNNASGIYNIASGTAINMIDLALLIKSLFSESISKVESADYPDPEENFRGLYDIKKAERILSWKPEIKIEDGIVQIANHLRNTK